MCEIRRNQTFPGIPIHSTLSPPSPLGNNFYRGRSFRSVSPQQRAHSSAFDWTAAEEITAATIPDIPLDRTVHAPPPPLPIGHSLTNDHIRNKPARSIHLLPTGPHTTEKK